MVRVLDVPEHFQFLAKVFAHFGDGQLFAFVGNYGGPCHSDINTRSSSLLGMVAAR